MRWRRWRNECRKPDLTPPSMRATIPAARHRHRSIATPLPSIARLRAGIRRHRCPHRRIAPLRQPVLRPEWPPHPHRSSRPGIQQLDQLIPTVSRRQDRPTWRWPRWPISAVFTDSPMRRCDRRRSSRRSRRRVIRNSVIRTRAIRRNLCSPCPDR